MRSSHWPAARPHSITPSQGSTGAQSSVTGLRVVRPTQFVQRVSNHGCCATCGSTRHARPSSHSPPRSGAATRASTSITAKPCSTPKLIQLRGNISADPADTSAAQPAIWAHRRQKRGQPWPASSAAASDRPAVAMNSDTIAARCTVQNGSR